MKRFGLKMIAMMAALLLLVGMVSCAKSEASDSVAMNAQGTVAQTGAAGMNAMADKSEIALDMEEGGIAEEKADADYAPKIIKTAELHCETKGFEDANGKLEALVSSLGGYVQESSVTGKGIGATEKQSRQAKYIFRIPAERLDAFLQSTGEILNVTSTTTASEDVSAEYYDIEARLEVLESERQLLQQMLSQTNDVSKMVTIENRLYDVIYEIESYETMLRVYDGKVAYSTVTLHLAEVVDYTAVVRAEDSFGQRVGKAFREGWQDFGRWAQDFLVGLVAALPVLLLLGALMTGGIFLGRALHRRRLRRKAARKENSTDA